MIGSSWTVDQAEKLSLTGFVKNDSDGTVTGEAQGSNSSIDQFTDALNKGPGPAKVQKVHHEEISTKEGEKGFGQ